MIKPADLAACRALLANGSRTFLAASWLLPRSVRDAACALYAFCRVADDAVDRCEDSRIDDAVDSLRERCESCMPVGLSIILPIARWPWWFANTPSRSRCSRR